MVFSMKCSAVLAFFLGTALVAQATETKCTWSKTSSKCEFNAASVSVSFSGKVGAMLSLEKDKKSCIAKSGSKTECEDAGCVYNPSSSKCIYAEEHTKRVEIYGDLTGCKEMYKKWFSARDCETYFTADTCNAATNCNWQADENADANATAVKYYDSDAEMCLDYTPKAGDCQTNYTKMLCGTAVSQSTINDVAGKLYSLPMICSAAADATAMKTCVEGELTCTEMATTAISTILDKVNSGTALTGQEEFDLATAKNACFADSTCSDYADMMFPVPLLVDLPDLSCSGNSNETLCEGQSNCFWLPSSGGSCMKVADIRKTNFGGDTCILTKVQVAEKESFATDALMIAHYKEWYATYISAQMGCGPLDGSDCSSNSTCQLTSVSTASCSTAGVATFSTPTSTCGAKPVDYEEEKSDVLFGADAADTMTPLEDSCEALSTEATCTAATYTDAETANLNSLKQTLDAASGTASSARLAACDPALSWLLTGVAVAFAKA